MAAFNALFASCMRDIATCSFMKRGKSPTKMAKPDSAPSACGGECKMCAQCTEKSLNRDQRVLYMDHSPPHHCEEIVDNKEENYSTNSLQRISVGRYFIVSKVCLPSTIFKTVVLFLTFSSIEAFPARNEKFSPVLRSIVGKLNSFPTFTINHDTLDILQRFTRNAPNFHRESYRRVHVRAQHETRSCEDFVANLSHMHQFAYSEASKFFKRPHRKRDAAHRLNLNRSWGEICNHAFRQYSEMSCYMNSRPSVYGRHTNEVKAALNSMTNLVQQEMNRINFPYNNDRTCSTNIYLQMPDYTAARQVLFNMFTLNSLIKQGCSTKTHTT